MIDNGRDFSRIIEAARIHYANLKLDIENASTRIEHIRLSALAQEAQNLLTDLEVFEIGLVYSHVADTKSHFERMQARAQQDLPDFKSPYIPPQPTL
jgi:hypothetical protein